jgi:hypothetical protein
VLKEEQRFRVHGGKMPNRSFGSRRPGVTSGYRKLHSGKLYVTDLNKY